MPSPRPYTAARLAKAIPADDDGRHLEPDEIAVLADALAGQALTRQQTRDLAATIRRALAALPPRSALGGRLRGVADALEAVARGPRARNG